MTDRSPLSRMQASVDTGALTGHLAWFSQVPRDTGGEGEERAANYIASGLEAAGGPHHFFSK